MKAISSLFIIILSTSILYSNPKDSVIIDFLKVEHNFGQINNTTKEVSFTFEYVNKGNAPCIIKSVNPDCKCAIATWSSKPTKPGEKSIIKIQLEITDINGSFSKKIIVMSNAIRPEKVLILAGKVMNNSATEEFEYSVGDLGVKSKHINIGIINKGEIKTKTVPIINRSKKPMKIQAEDIPEYVSLKIEPETINPGDRGLIIVTYNSNEINEWDNIIDRTTFIINDKKFSKQKVAITANICEDFSGISPEEALLSPIAFYGTTTKYLDTIKTTNEIDLKFLVRNDGKSTLVIRDVNPSCGCTAVKPEKLEIAPGDSTYINATFNPKKQNGAFNYTITIITNDPNNYRQFLWMKGYVKN